MLSLRGGQGAEQEAFGLFKTVIFDSGRAEYLGKIGMDRRSVVDDEHTAVDARLPGVHGAVPAGVHAFIIGSILFPPHMPACRPVVQSIALSIVAIGHFARRAQNNN
ncbi:hypothetical protein D3C84_762360 [compost metagenome]